MRATNGFQLDPLARPPSSGGPGMFPDSIGQQKVLSLQDENESLKSQLRAAMAEITSLREENIELRGMLGNSPSLKNKTGAQSNVVKAQTESTFITKGAEIPMVNCENCGKEVQKEKYQLHYNFCLKNVTKCQFCYEPIACNELDDHIQEAKGNIEVWRDAINTLNTEKLLKMLQHGNNPFMMRDSDEYNGFGILHHIVRSNQLPVEQARKMITFVSQHGGTEALNFTNKHGETALHLCSGKQPNEELAKVLLIKGASASMKNAIGDTAIKLAQRCGHMELAMLFQQQETLLFQQQTQTTMRSTQNSFMAQTPPNHNKPKIVQQNSYGERTGTRGNNTGANTNSMRRTRIKFTEQDDFQARSATPTKAI